MRIADVGHIAECFSVEYVVHLVIRFFQWKCIYENWKKKETRK